MAARNYFDFDVTVRPQDGGKYSVESRSGGREAREEFEAPFDEGELEKLRTIRQSAREFGDSPNRGGELVDNWNELRRLGEQLYGAVFCGEVGKSLVSRLESARQEADPRGVRIRLHLNEAEDLIDWPWECLHDPVRGFLALEPDMPVVRYLSYEDRAKPPLVTRPIKMLVAVANPQGKLDAETEWGNINKALEHLTQKNVISLTRAPDGTYDALYNHLEIEANRPHIFHFIGHGGFVPDENASDRQPALQFEDERVPIDRLVNALNFPSLRLAVLNSCDGARRARRDPFSGLAQGLVRRRLPAVVAMQCRVTDKSAIAFAKSFYTAIADNQPVDEAVTAGRKRIVNTNNQTEFGTPVLFMRSQDGRVFNVDVPSEQRVRQLKIENLTREAHLAIDEKQYEIAIRKLTQIQGLVNSLFDGG